MVLVDAETGTEAEPVVVDRATGRRVDGPDFVFTAGPAASKPFRDRYQDGPTRPTASWPTGPITVTTITDLDDFKALDPFFHIIEKGLDGIADGEHFFDLLAGAVIFEYIITTLPATQGVEGHGRRRALPPRWPSLFASLVPADTPDRTGVRHRRRCRRCGSFETAAGRCGAVWRRDRLAG